MRQENFRLFKLMRLLLALEVVVSHSSSYFFEKAWDGWIMAVPAFLGVSGFLVLHSYETTLIKKDFVKKRILRIMPALFLSMCISAILLGKGYLEGSILIWLTGGMMLSQSGNVPLWSLLWEEIAYGFLFFAAKIYRQENRAYLLTLFAASLGLGYFSEYFNFSPLFKIVSYLPSSFLMGNLIYIHRIKIIFFSRKLGYWNWLLLVGVCLWSQLVYSKLALTMPPFWLQTFAIIYVGLGDNFPLRMKLPDLSYGIYIYHMPLLNYFIKIPSTPLIDISTLLYSASLLSLCIFSWYLIEAPFLSLKKYFSSDFASKIRAD